MNQIKILLLVFLIAHSYACETPSYLSKPKDIQYTIRGSHVIIVNDRHRSLGGELIAITNDSIYLLIDGNVIANEKSLIAKATLQVALTSDNPGGIAAWGSLLWITSISHGFFAVISLPINLIVGISTAVNASSATFDIIYPEQITWELMAKFARFPQGLPPNVNVSEIK